MYGLTGRRFAILGTTPLVTVSIFMAAAPVAPVPIVADLCFPLVPPGARWRSAVATG